MKRLPDRLPGKDGQTTHCIALALIAYITTIAFRCALLAMNTCFKGCILEEDDWLLVVLKIISYNSSFCLNLKVHT